MSLESRVELLKTASQSAFGVRELVERLHWKASKVVSLLKVMEEEGLVGFRVSRRGKRGRPKRLVEPTPLGLEFLESCASLAMKPLRSRRVDLERASREALYAERLVERGRDPFRLFLELNEVVRNIRVSSSTR